MTPAGPFKPATRVSAGPGLGPVSADANGERGRILQRLAGSAADPNRNHEVEVHEGLLLCGDCGRWYPIVGQIPEVLPDHLRSVERESPFFAASAAGMPADLRAAFERFTPSPAHDDAGAHHKKAEIGIKSKIEDPTFFGPGYSSPFNVWNTTFTLYLVQLFGAVVPLLDVKNAEPMLDSGCGYGWTTEWLFKSGVDAVGVDICRDYLEIGITRMGAWRPHVVVGDVEQLPIRSAAMRAVLAYESFHHIPNRPRAMQGFCRVLVDGGRIVLAEPGAAHEHAEVSVDVMAKYGILEKGMELEDVADYADGTTFAAPEQLFLLRVDRGGLQRLGDTAFARTQSVLEGNVFRLTKGIAAAAQPAVVAGSPVRRAGRRIKRTLRRGIKSALIRAGLD